MLGRSDIHWLLTLLLIESAAIIVAYQISSPIECRATGMEMVCRGIRGMFISTFCAVAGFAILLWARKAARHRLIDALGDTEPARLWAAVHASGVVAIFLPLLIIPTAKLNEYFPYIFSALVVGAALAVLGAFFWALRPRSWWRWLKSESYLPVLIMVLAAMIPFLAMLVQPLWAIEFVASTTFLCVEFLLSLVADDVFVDPVRAWIGTPEFVVAVASQCSGVEGFALITGFMALYAILFRETLKQGAFWLVVWPVALLVSWAFNIVRIATLILLGEHVSPELAVDGFHSFAGWLLFTFLALGVLYVAQSVPALRRGHPAPRQRQRLRTDPVAALIVPFIAFMISGVIVQAFWENPALGYPFQVVVMIGALFWVRGALLPQIALSPDPISVGIGLVVGLGWVWFSDPSQGDNLGLATLGGHALVAWALVRTLGTTVLVPIVEEAFFRGYVLARLDTGGVTSKVIAIAASTSLFAVLHGRIILAGVAGLFFAAAMLRRGRLGDAIVAHVVANATVAAAAWYTGQWSVI